MSLAIGAPLAGRAASFTEIKAPRNCSRRKLEMHLPSLPKSQPWHQRSVDHIGHALAADRADREINFVEAEAMGGDEFERKALGGKLGQRELAGFIAVTARALHGDEFHRE